MGWFGNIFAKWRDTLQVPRPAEPPDDIAIAPQWLHLRETTRAQAVTNALRWVGRESRYRLGGGADVDKPNPFAKDGTCDCSGFTAHVTGHNRIQRIGGRRVSYYTDNIIRDAEGPQHMYERAPGDDVLGCIIVKPGVYVGGARVRPGHVGIIVAVLPGFVRGGDRWWEHLVVAHCTPNRGRKNSVVESDAKAWRKKGYILTPKYYRKPGQSVVA